jgi:hypothetical protein
LVINDVLLRFRSARDARAWRTAIDAVIGEQKSLETSLDRLAAPVFGVP